jgi:bidirectional [NiFe] hydrogenase diaphorase subunit
MNRHELTALAERERRSRPAVRLHICTASGCRVTGALGVQHAMEETVTKRRFADRVGVVGVGCLGLCGRGPLVEMTPGGTLFGRVTPTNAGSLVEAAVGGTPHCEVIDRGMPFFDGQLKVVCENSGEIDPERVEEYVAVNGYRSLYDAVTGLTPAEVVQAVTESGLRGRGGAGYPTGLKWATVAKARAGQKFVVCNGDEGDPGAFMDRTVMESDPHRVLEGMAIAAYAVGASQGYIYVRAEYPLAVERLRKAIEQANRLGLLGTAVFGSRFDFRIDVRVGAGAYVCGEETALMASIEGGRGTPHPRPPYPAESGLWGRPTLLNNVETFANVPVIIRRGAEWYASIGTARSKGTKVFSLSGAVRNSGLVEVPMGTTLRQVVEVMGDAPAGKVKAVQTGGPSGGCVPAEHLDTPVDYESLQALGSIMGSGGMVVLDDSTGMVDVARFFMEFCAEESCGKCVPCRVGTVQMHHLLDRIATGNGTRADLARLEALLPVVREASLCGLGQSAPNPVLSTLRHFRHEYEALLKPDVSVNGNGRVPLPLRPA